MKRVVWLVIWLLGTIYIAHEFDLDYFFAGVNAALCCAVLFVVTNR